MCKKKKGTLKIKLLLSTNGEKLFGINKLESNVIFQRDIDNGEKGGIKGKGKKCLGGA